MGFVDQVNRKIWLGGRQRGRPDDPPKLVFSFLTRIQNLVSVWKIPQNNRRSAGR